MKLKLKNSGQQSAKPIPEKVRKSAHKCDQKHNRVKWTQHANQTASHSLIQPSRHPID